MAKFEKDILTLIPPPKTPPSRTSRRIGIHTSTAGGVENAAERAYRLGCSAFQVFSSSPRQWKPYELGASQCEVMNSLRMKCRNQWRLSAPNWNARWHSAPITSCSIRVHFGA
jgi:hypothetical protein